MHLSRKKETIIVYSHQPLRGSTFDIYATPDGRNVRSFSDNEYIKVDMKGEIFDRPNLYNVVSWHMQISWILF